MADDAERLVVLLEARIRDFEKNMAKASGTAGKAYGGMRRDSRSATAAMEADMVRSTSRVNQLLASTSTKIGAYGKAFGASFFGGALGGLAAGSIVATLQNTAKAVAQVGDEAKRAGVNVQAFQEWKFVAEQNRIGVDAMVDGLKELNLRADEFIQTGGGPAAEAFQRLGYSAEELKTKLKDPSALLLEIIGRLGQMDKAAQIRISDELFGGSAGERFVELLAQGERGIRDTIARAHEFGIVMDAEMIKKAAELDRQFNIVANTVGTALKTAVVEAASLLSQFVDRFRDFENRQNASLDMNLRTIGKDRLDIENQILQLRQQQDEASGSWFGGGMSSAAAQQQIDLLKEQDAALAEQERQILAVLEARRALANQPLTGTGWTPPPSPPGGFGSGKPGGGRTKDEFKATRDGFAEMIGATEMWREEQERSNRVMEDFGNLAIDAGNSLATALADGRIEGRELLSILTQIIPQLMRMAQLAGGFGNLFSGIFGGGGMGNVFPSAPTGLGLESGVGLYAKGGIADRPSIFAEAGPEAAVPLPDGRRIPVDLRGGDQRPLKVVINEAPGGDKAQTSMSADGSELVVTMRKIARAEASDVMAKGLKPSLGAGFGVTPKVARRS